MALKKFFTAIKKMQFSHFISLKNQPIQPSLAPIRTYAVQVTFRHIQKVSLHK